MKIEDLNFGNIEGKDEFDLSNGIFKNSIDDVFFLDKKINYESFLKGEKSYIYGHKGTGKTSLLKYLEYKADKEKNKTISILFKDIKNNTLIYSTFLKLLGSVHDKNRASKAFWQWFILSIIIKENNIETTEDNLIFYTKNTLFSKLSTFLTKIINVKYKYQSANHELEIGTNFSDLKIDENNDLFNAGIKIDILQNLIQKNLKDKFYIFIDELETSKMSENYFQDSILIKNLIIMVNSINKLSENIFITLAVRTEVLNNIFSAGDEINKLLESKGICIQWEYDKYSITHPLIQIILKKIRYSMKNNSNINIINKSITLSDKEIFDYWFEEELVEGIYNSEQVLLNNTWLKPRDIIRLMNILQKEAFYSQKFNKSFFKEAIKKYSDASWDEIQEELVSILDKDEILSIIKTLTNYESEFSYIELKARIIRNSNFDHPQTEKIIDAMYDTGIIGNKFLDETGFLTYKYSFRGNRYIDKNVGIEVHKGLWECFTISKKLTRNKNSSNNENNDDDNTSELAELLHKLK
ncbi:MAG: ATP-binding protein [Sulfurimonas sp.]|uniref:P-loop ATPase, Sll1717 family n=1 Tax=Sulfurimonas sp. TaxID=2022749 RepID=UPI0025E59704|nr:hypothetical protein [Sulfurimonas sp.]MCK9491735.1 ATP-binding protein [Sulfurimonas sp.]